MVYHEVLPSKPLTPYVNCFWMIEDNEVHHLRDISFPDGCLEIIFNMGATVSRAVDHRNFIPNPSAELIGQMTRPFSIRSNGACAMLGIRFYPHTVRYFTRENISMFNDQVIHPADIFGNSFHILSNQISGASGMRERIAILETFLINKLDSISTKHQIVDHAVRNMLIQKDKSDLNRILKDCGISARYLQKLFLEFVGVSPKMFIKIIRFQKTFKYLYRQNTSLTTVAYDCGYFDQSHFIRDFKLLSGTPPTRFLSESHPYNSFFLQESSRSYLFDY